MATRFRPAGSIVHRRGRLLFWLLPLLLIGLFFMLLVPTMCRAREPANRIKCSSNLRQLGLAIKTYADAHDGVLPADWRDAVAGADITSDVFCCPSSSTVDRPPGTTPAEWTAALSDSHYCSYVYAAAGLNAKTLTGEDIVAFEPPTDHNNDGINVLFADGHVDWSATRGPEYAHLLADLAAGKRPLRLAEGRQTERTPD